MKNELTIFQLDKKRKQKDRKKAFPCYYFANFEEDK